MKLSLITSMLALGCASHAASLASSTPEPQKIKTVIVISVDGLGRHLLDLVHTPSISRIIREGQEAPRAETILPTRTIPGHVSMLTGVDPERHGNLHNEKDDNLKKVKVPTIFDLTKANGLTSSTVLGKEKIRYVIDTGSIDHIRIANWPLLKDIPSRDPDYIAASAVRELAKNKPNVLFVHFGLVDTMGHILRWESWFQKRALKQVDYSIGRIFDTAKHHLPEGSFALIITADHGGHDGSHGQVNAQGQLVDPARDLMIPWIVYGARLKTDVQLVKVYDTAPTVAALLGMKVPAEWNWQGKSVLQIQ